jgi:predicted PurR-regulated permease PerM
VSVWDALTTRQIARILFTTAGFLVVLYLLVQIRSTLLLLAIAIFLAVALGPAVDFVSRGRLPRAAAILIVYVLIFCVFSGVLALIVPPVINGATDLSRDIPSYVDDLRNNRAIRDFDNKYDITSKLRDEAEKLPEKLGDAAGALQSIAAGAVNATFQLLTILTMTFFLLLDGRRIANFLITRSGRHREERLRGIAERIYKSTSGYVAGALTITSINGILTFIVLSVLGVPFAVPLAVMMSFFGLIPLVGATIGGVLILLVTLFTDFPSATIIYGIFLIFYQQLENNVLQPFIFKRTVNVPPLAVIVAILAGSSLLGIVGALVAIPIAAALQIVIKEFYRGETIVSGSVILPDDVPPPDDEPPPPAVIVEPPPGPKSPPRPPAGGAPAAKPPPGTSTPKRASKPRPASQPRPASKPKPRPASKPKPRRRPPSEGTP